MGRMGIGIYLIVIVVLVLAVNLIASQSLGGKKIDLTEEKLYTLSDGTKQILGSLDDELTIRLFVSKRAMAEYSGIVQYADRIEQLLRQYETNSNGKIDVEVVEPRPFTEEEEMAVKFGMQAIPAQKQGGEPIYFGLAVGSEVGETGAMPFLDPQRESFIEYDLTRLVASVANPKQNKIGVISSLSVMGSQPANPMMQQQSSQPWILISELRKQYEVVDLSTQATEIPADIDLLLVLHPKNLGATTEYAIDQYIVGGGRAILMVDPFCIYESITFPARDMQARFSAEFNSDLPKLLEAWGLKLPAGKVLGDRTLATLMNLPEGPAKHLAVLTLTEEQTNEDEIVSSGLETIGVLTGGWLEVADSPYEVSTLFESSANSGEIDAFQLKLGADTEQMKKEFKELNKVAPIAVKLTGKFKSAYEARPEDAEDGAPEFNAGGDTENTVIVIADADMAVDDFIVRKQQIFGSVIIQPVNDNLAFLTNTAEYLMNRSELIGLRTRGKSQRPFTKVRQLEEKAQDEWKEREEQLAAELQEVQTKLNQMQAGRNEQGQAILSQAQIDELQRFRDRRVEISRELRVVQGNLLKDIEALGTRLKLINIALMPILVLGAGFIPGVVRNLKIRQS